MFWNIYLCLQCDIFGKNYRTHGAILSKVMKAISAQVVSCCALTNRNEIMHYMHGNIPFVFYYWAADLGVHLLLLNSSTVPQQDVQDHKLLVIPRLSSSVSSGSTKTFLPR